MDAFYQDAFYKDGFIREWAFVWFCSPFLLFTGCSLDYPAFGGEWSC